MKEKRDFHATRVLEIQALLNKSIGDHLESNAPLFLHEKVGPGGRQTAQTPAA